MAARAKRFEYAVEVDVDGRFRSDRGDTLLELDEAWTPEHLVLAGLVHCTLTSLAYHARRAGIDVVASGSASGAVTKRESDGRYAFVEIDCAIEFRLDSDATDVRDLVEKAERDCFVGASLTAAPRYRWRVNGADYSY